MKVCSDKKHGKNSFSEFRSRDFRRKPGSKSDVNYKQGNFRKEATVYRKPAK